MLIPADADYDRHSLSLETLFQGSRTKFPIGSFTPDPGERTISKFHVDSGIPPVNHVQDGRALEAGRMRKLVTVLQCAGIEKHLESLWLMSFLQQSTYRNRRVQPVP